MLEVRSGLEAFFRGEMDLKGLLGLVDGTLTRDPAGAPQLLEEIDSLYRRGRLPPQLHSMLEEQVTTASQRLGIPTSPSVRQGAPSRGRPAQGACATGSEPAAPPPSASRRAPPHPANGKTRVQSGPVSRRSASSPQSREASGGRFAATGTSGPGRGPGRAAGVEGAATRETLAFGSGSGPLGSYTGARGFPPQVGEPSVGQVLKDRFELEEVIGRGGMSVVFRARDRRKVEAHDRNPYVALKLLNESFKRHPESLKTLQREARKSQDLKHPNIIGVFDFDRDEHDNCFVAMELLTGTPLSQVIRELRPQGGMEAREAYRLTRQMGLALAAAHNHRPPIVHSDFKPGNVFLTKNKDIKVFDFGIARAARPAGGGELTELTNFDAGVLGAMTPAYASPEMLAGLEPDPRDDIYALAIVVYELLTGYRPFGRERTAAEAIAAGLRPARAKKLNRRQWKGLQRALAFERERRTPTVEQFLEDLSFRRSRAPFYAAAAAALVGAAAWFFLVEPLRMQQREEAILEGLAATPPGELSTLAELVATLPQPVRARTYEAFAAKLSDPVVDVDKEASKEALAALQGLPAPVQDKAYSWVQEILIARVLGGDHAVARDAAELALELPPDRSARIFSRVSDQLVARLAEVDVAARAGLLQTADLLPEKPRHSLYARARRSILEYFRASALHAFSPKAGRYDYQGAWAIVERAASFYPDSKTVDSLRLRLRADRDLSLSELETGDRGFFPSPAAQERERRADAEDIRRQLIEMTKSMEPVDSSASAALKLLDELSRIAPDDPLAASGRGMIEDRFLESAGALGDAGQWEAGIERIRVGQSLLPESVALAKALSSLEAGRARALAKAREDAAARQGVRDARARAAEKRRQREEAERAARDQAARLERARIERKNALDYWELVKDSDNIEAVKAFLDAFDDPVLTPIARARLALMMERSRAAGAAVSGTGTRTPPSTEPAGGISRQGGSAPDAREQAQEAPAPADRGPDPPPGDGAAEQDALARVAEIPPHLVQHALKDLGFLRGAADGLIGPGTRRAIRAYQKDAGYEATGKLTPEQKVALISEAAREGHARSQDTLGMMTAQGVGVPSDPSEAARWFKSAAEQGDANGAYNLGLLYRDGRGVEKSLPQARRYFESARTGGHPQAAGALRALDES